jgi:hypothetical protein
MELFIRLWRNRAKIKNLLESLLFWRKCNNVVGFQDNRDVAVNQQRVSTSINNPQHTEEETYSKDRYEIGFTITIMLIFVNFSLLRNRIDLWNIAQAFFDAFLHLIPIYWVVSSEGISDYAKLKFNQLKLRFGYF